METNFTNPPENPVPFSHLNGANKPAMVDTTRKPVTLRTAVARAVVRVPARVAEAFDGTELQSPKGPVFQAAITAGVMGADRFSVRYGGAPQGHRAMGLLQRCRAEVYVSRCAEQGSERIPRGAGWQMNTRKEYENAK